MPSAAFTGLAIWSKLVSINWKLVVLENEGDDVFDVASFTSDVGV